MSNAQSPAGIVVGFPLHVGGCWNILDRRVRVASKCNPFEFARSLPSLKNKDAPPLHHDEGEEVYGLRLMEQVVRQRGGVISELEGYRRKRYAVLLQVPQRPARIVQRRFSQKR